MSKRLHSGQSVDIKQSQSLLLSPKLQQAIRILNMNGIELTQTVNHMLTQNFMLELDKEFDVQTTKSETENEDENDDVSSTIDHLGELEFDSDWQDSYEDWQENAKSASSDNEESFESYTAPEISLNEYLEEQIRQMPISESVQESALILVYSLADDGYLRDPLNEIAETHKQSVGALEAGLKVLQSCQPTGIGARSLQECLSLQLEALPSDTPYLPIAKRITNRYLFDLYKDNEGIQKKMRINQRDFDEALKLLKSLNPLPAGEFMSQREIQVQPDIFVREKNGISFIEMNEEALPSLSINKMYAQLAKECKKERDRELLTGQINEARWFIQALEKRADTIKKVASILVALQQDFFQHGELAMRPLNRKNIAEILKVHESTVSRAVSGKYLLCKRGLFELRYFFSAQTQEELSTTAIKALIGEMIEKENPKKPLSDQQLTEELNKLGHTIARRTVAKYREALGFESAMERRKK